MKFDYTCDNSRLAAAAQLVREKRQSRPYARCPVLRQIGYRFGMHVAGDLDPSLFDAMRATSWNSERVWKLAAPGRIGDRIFFWSKFDSELSGHASDLGLTGRHTSDGDRWHQFLTPEDWEPVYDGFADAMEAVTREVERLEGS